MTVTQISWFKSSDAYRANPTLVNEPAQRLKDIAGVQRLYVAFEIEKPKIAYIVTIWGSYDNYLSAVKVPAYTAALDALKPALDGTLKDIETVFVDYTTTPEEALAAPVSEIVITELKPGETEEDVIILDKVIAASGVTLGNHWGHVHNKPEEYGLFVGWESVESHAEAARKGLLAEVIKKSEKTLKYSKIANGKFREI